MSLWQLYTVDPTFEILEDVWDNRNTYLCDGNIEAIQRILQKIRFPRHHEIIAILSSSQIRSIFAFRFFNDTRRSRSHSLEATSMPNDAEELVKGPSISSSNLLEITFIVLRLVLLTSRTKPKRHQIAIGCIHIYFQKNRSEYYKGDIQ